VIDECDYYLLIIGARYGSTDSEGINYTEREFDYAVSTKKSVIALLHSDIERLPKNNFDDDPALLNNLKTFREKIKTGRIVRMWNNRDQLMAGLYPAINTAIQIYPAPGWVRGDAAASQELLQQHVKSDSAYTDLQKAYDDIIENNSAKLSGLASLSDRFTIHFRYQELHGSKLAKRSGAVELGWDRIFMIVGPELFSPKNRSWISAALKQFLLDSGRHWSSLAIIDIDTNTIKLYLYALGLINVYESESVGAGVQEYISLTEKGRAHLVEIMAIRGATPVQDEGAVAQEGAR
jgi:Domain of unknown function (DUF4062)